VAISGKFNIRPREESGSKGSILPAGIKTENFLHGGKRALTRESTTSPTHHSKNLRKGAQRKGKLHRIKTEPISSGCHPVATLQNKEKLERRRGRGGFVELHKCFFL